MAGPMGGAKEGRTDGRTHARTHTEAELYLDIDVTLTSLCSRVIAFDLESQE